MGLEVIVGREYARCNELLLQDGHEVEQVLGRVVADVIDLVRRHGEAVRARLLLGSVAHHAHNALDDVVDVGKVAFAVAVVENPDGLSRAQFVGEAEVGHIRAAGGAVNGKEAQAGRRDVVELRVGVGHQLVALFGRRIEGNRVVNLVVGRVRHLRIGAVNR